MLKYNNVISKKLCRSCKHLEKIKNKAYYKCNSMRLTDLEIQIFYETVPDCDGYDKIQK